MYILYMLDILTSVGTDALPNVLIDPLEDVMCLPYSRLVLDVPFSVMIY
jgi:hypothetical protein